MRGSAFHDPLWHLNTYGIQNAVVQECIEREFYQPGACWACHGKGFRLGIYGEKVYRKDRFGVRTHARCARCGGTGLGADRRPHVADFVDPESLGFAFALGIRVDDHNEGCRAVDDPRLHCRCITTTRGNT